MLKKIGQSPAIMAAGGRLLAGYIRFVHFTGRQIIRSPEDLDQRIRDLAPVIYAFWHGQFLMIPAFSQACIPTRVIVARHGDAEFIGETIKRFDMELLRGAGAGHRRKDRGGAAALRSAITSLGEGYSVSLTADVPPGPARRAGLGIVSLARHSGCPILPVAIATSNYTAINSWSRMTINLPFSKIGVVVGEPIFVSRDADKANCEAARLAVEKGLHAATEHAYRFAEADPARATPSASSAAVTPTAAPGLTLNAYRKLTQIAGPAAPLIVSYRVRKGKEDPVRADERYGQTSLDRPAGKLIWFHAASVGETNAVLPVIKMLKAAHPEMTMLLTTGTVTSAKLAGLRAAEYAIHQYVPLDAPQYVRRFLTHWRPDLALLTESEIWPNLIFETAEFGVPIVLLNGRMSRRSFRRWRSRPGIARPLFSRIEVVLAQNELLAQRFIQLGARRAVAVGNLKIDAPPPPYDNGELEQLRQCLKGRRIFVAASTHPGEDEVVAEAHQKLRADFGDLLTIIVPRHPERGCDIETALRDQALQVCRRSLGETPHADSDIYIADTIGELGLFYALAPLSFIGGSVVPKGGQNPIEAVKLGSGVVTGPHWHNFKETYRELIRLDGCREVVSPESLAYTVRDLYGDQGRLETMVVHAEQALDNLSGALERTLAELDTYFLRRNELRHAS